MSKKFLYIIIGILILIILGFATHETTTTLIMKEKENGTTVDFGTLKKKKHFIKKLFF